MKRERIAALALIALVVAAPTYAQISFRGAASATASRGGGSEATRTASLSINKPADTVANDVLIASIAVRPSTAVIAPPPGWALVRRLDNPSVSSNSLAVFYRVALASEPATYTWDVFGASFIVGGVQVFSGVEAANPIASESGQTTPSGTTHTAPPITTPVAKAMLVSTHAFASSETWDPPIGMTESFDRRSEGGSAGISIESNRALQSVAGSTGAKTATADGKADVGNAHLLALRPANARPIVSLTSPASGSTFIAAASIPLAAAASDSDGTIQKVDFFHSGTNLIGTASSPPYTFWWTPMVPGLYAVTAVATDNQNATATSSPVNLTVINTAPTVSITSPSVGANFSAPANIVITASAADAEGAVQKVEFFHGGTNLIVSLTTAPYSFTWTGVPQGAYSLTAVVTDNQNASTTSAPVNVTVNREPALHFVHVDHLNTPRLIADGTGTAVWKWHNDEPFGSNPTDQIAGAPAAFEFPLRFIGTYSDSESNLLYNWHRYLDPARGQYLHSDPIGLDGGSLSTYVHVGNNPLQTVDPDGLKLWLCVRSCCGGIANHAYLYDDDTGRCCGDPGPTFRERDYIKTCKERGPGRDTCWSISSTPDDAEKALQCCNRQTRRTFYIPIFDDCQDRVDDCIRRLTMAPPNTPSERRFMRCDSCFRK